MSNIQFDTPANRIIAQQQPKNQFRIDTSLPDLSFLRQLSIQGRLRSFHGSFASAQGSDNSLLSVIPNNGTTLFIYSARISNTGGTITFSIFYENELRLRTVLTGVSGQGQGVFDQPYFDSFVGDGVKEFKIGYTSSVAGQKATTVLGWVENTSRIRDVTT